MPRLSQKDRRFLRMALQIAIDTEESLSLAYEHLEDKHLNDDGVWVAGPHPQAVEVQTRCAKNIAEFRRLLVTNFGGPQDRIEVIAVPLAELMRREPSNFKK